MSQPEKPTELIYLAGGSVYPALVAAGLAGVIIGLYSWWPYSAAGALTALIAVIAWLRANRSDIAVLPNEQQTDTAPIPLR